MREKTPAADSSADLPDASPESNPDTDPSLTGDDSAPAARAGRTVKIALIGALAIIVALGVFVAFLMMRAPEVTSSPSSQSAQDPASTEVTVETTPATPPSEPEQSTPEEPAAPPAPAPAPPAPAPAPPAPPAPAPVTPAVIPLKVTNMNAVVSGACTTKSTIQLTWTTTGATADSTKINVRTGGGTPVFNETWINMPASATYSFLNLDCTRSIWYFKMTITNGTETKEGLLTFANGKTAGWSSVK